MRKKYPFRSLTEIPGWLKKQCERCSNPFWVIPSQPKLRYCSDECRHESPLVRLLKNTTTNEQGCVLFAGGLNSDGYGNIKFDGKQWRAHRLSWHLQRGPIPDGFDVLHTCKKCRACVKIDHLYLGTVQDNADDRMEQGHHAMGEKHGWSKLTEEQVKEIKRLKGNATLLTVSEQFKVSIHAIWNIWNGKTWRDIHP